MTIYYIRKEKTLHNKELSSYGIVIDDFDRVYDMELLNLAYSFALRRDADLLTIPATTNSKDISNVMSKTSMLLWYESEFKKIQLSGGAVSIAIDEEFIIFTVIGATNVHI